MTKVGIRALKQNASAVVASAASGEKVTITDRGRAVALMVPLTTSRLKALIEADQARPALRRLTDLSPAPRRRRDGRRLSDELAEMRDSERS
ncbi:MAG: type II toxin-antitoxin system prevent-host-death family antitoxin [Acidimicrobiia bacterium]